MHLADAFIQSDLQLHSGYTLIVSTCVPWELNPQPFALLTQCSTTEPHRNTVEFHQGGGVGALEAPQERHRQERRTGTSRAEQTDRDHGGAGSSEGHGGAGSSGDHGGAGCSGDHGGAGSTRGHDRWSLGHLASTPSAPTAGTLLPPPQNFPGEVRGYQEPSGAKQTGQYKTRQDSPPGPDRQDRTGQNMTTGKPSRSRQTRQDIPQEPEALLG